jgi:hypothetical protein
MWVCSGRGAHSPFEMVPSTVAYDHMCGVCGLRVPDIVLSLLTPLELANAGISKTAPVIYRVNTAIISDRAVYPGSAYDILLEKPETFVVPPTKAAQLFCDYKWSQPAPADPVMTTSDYEADKDKAIKRAGVAMRQQVARRLRTWPMCHVQNRPVDLVFSVSDGKIWAAFWCKHCK